MVESHGGVCRERKMQVAGQGLEEIWEATRGRMPATRDINRIKSWRSRVESLLHGQQVQQTLFSQLLGNIEELKRGMGIGLKGALFIWGWDIICL
jgi:hypothetical protein